MSKEFTQSVWSPDIEQELQKLLQIAVAEDVSTVGDLTSMALIPEHLHGTARVAVRQNGIIAGLNGIPAVLKAVDERLQWKTSMEDGTAVKTGDIAGFVSGPVRKLLTAERLFLNLVGKLSGIATLCSQYVQKVDGTRAKIYDTRKTTLGWRRLEKYAVRCGGGYNHRTGLYDAVLIKDNHLAFGQKNYSPAQAVEIARKQYGQSCIIEIEVDTLEQLYQVLPAKPDMVLLDNMKVPELSLAVDYRNKNAPETELEASGGINLSTVRAVAESGLERISVGAVTHSAVALDIGLDWETN